MALYVALGVTHLNSLTSLAVILGLAVLLALWVACVSFYYRVRAEPPTRLWAVTEDGWRIAIHFRPATKKRFAEPVLLCHGLAANRFNLDFEPPYSLAHFLRDSGFDCYTVDWRGAGASSAAPSGKFWGSHSADDWIQKDAPAVLARVLEHSRSREVFWLGHSLGGLVGLVSAGRDTRGIAGVLTLGAPSFFVHDAFLKYAITWASLFAWPFGLRQRLASIALAPFLGHVVLPLSDVIFNPQHIPPALQRKVYARLISSMSRKMLLQFRDWIVNDQFRSLDGAIDYRKYFEKVRVPVLVMAGSSDRLASAEAVRRGFDLVGAADKTLMVFGIENGDKLEYGHGDLIFGSNAPNEIFPGVLRWLEAHATPVELNEPRRSEQG
jgi:pimeloyl-ACP methyl ester carboxylesterase